MAQHPVVPWNGQAQRIAILRQKERRSKPWVVLKGGSPNKFLMDLDSDPLVMVTSQTFESTFARTALRENSPDYALHWFGRTVHESHIEKNENKAEQSSDGVQPSLWHKVRYNLNKRPRPISSSFRRSTAAYPALARTPN